MPTTMLLLLALPATTLAADVRAPEGPDEGALCLSDGQSLAGDEVTEEPGYRTVRIGEAHVRVPADSLGGSCPELEPSPDREATTVRTVVLADGQRLFGTPHAASGDAAQVELLDEHRIYVPRDLVVDVTRFRPEDPGLEPLRKARNRQARRKVLGVAANIGLGLVGAALVGGAAWGAWQARPQVPPSPRTR